MDINFKMLTVETFDKNLNGEVKGRFKFKDEKTLKAAPKNLGTKLRQFVVKEIKKGNLPYKKVTTTMYAMVRDVEHGEISCLIQPEALQ